MSREAFEAWATTKDWYSTARSDEEGRDYSSDLCEYAWRAWQAAQADAFERAVKVAAEHDVAPTDDPLGVQECITDAIRAMAKETT